MPREARRNSETGIYHIILRGIGRKNIFHDDFDFKKFLNILEKVKEKSHYIIYTYCLMTNHIHILIKEGNETIGDTIKRIAISYAQFYNIKYESIGHLFQDRFTSEPVESDEYFVRAFRYILQNPIKAGIEKDIYFYKWNGFDNNLIDKEYILNYFSTEEELRNFLLEENNDSCLEYSNRSSESEVTDRFKKLLKGRLFDLLSKKEKLEIVIALRKSCNTNNKQISRVTGLTRGMLQKMN